MGGGAPPPGIAPPTGAGSPCAPLCREGKALGWGRMRLARAELGEGSVRVSRVSPPPAPQWWQWVCMGRGGRWTPPQYRGSQHRAQCRGGRWGQFHVGAHKGNPLPPPAPPDSAPMESQEEGVAMGGFQRTPFFSSIRFTFLGEGDDFCLPPLNNVRGGGGRGHIERRALLGRGRPVGVVSPPPPQPVHHVTTRLTLDRHECGVSAPPKIKPCLHPPSPFSLCPNGRWGAPGGLAGISPPPPQ